MKRLLSLASAGLSALAAMSADIVWTIGANTVNDTDVRTDGRLVYAYAGHDCTVNGVTFMGSPGATNWLQDVTFSTTYAKAESAYWYDPNGLWSAVSDGYKSILKGGSYTSPNVKNNTYTLHHLVPGRRYLVQWWFNDMRDGRTSSLADIGGSSALRLTMTGHPLGAHAVGQFTADAEAQSFSAVYNIEGQINALQLRCLDPDAEIAWTVHATTGADDVLTEGAPVYGYVAGSTKRQVRGVFFDPIGSGEPTAFGEDVAFSPKLGSVYTVFFSNTPGYEADYAGLLGCGFYRENSSPEGMSKRYVTLRNLTPGDDYAVQIWVADNRAGSYGNRWMTLDGQVTLRHCATSTTGGPGMYAVGRFTAVGTEQTFVCVHSTSGNKTNYAQELFGALQVRCLTPAPGLIAWTKGDTAADGSVDVRGNCLYAYSANAITVNGTPFAAAAGGSTMGDDVALSSSFSVSKTAFVSHSENFDEYAIWMLRGAYYHLKSDLANVTFTLRHLVAGRRYLVQLWSCDDRDGRGGSGHSVGDVRLEYNNLHGGSALRGQWLKGVFTAAGDTQSFTVDTPTGYEWTFNALQVRELDAWSSQPLTWTARDLTADVTTSIETQGTLLYAFGMATSAFTANGVTFESVDTTKAVWGNGAVMIDGAMLRHTAFYTGTDVTGDYRNILACGLFDSESGVSAKTFTLGKLLAGHRYMVQYFVSDTRNASVASRTATFSDGTQLRFGDNGDGQHAFGMTAVGTFVAAGATKAFTVGFWEGGVQINGIQVRDLGSDGIVWVGGASGSWSQDGAGWARGGVSCEGTVLWDAATGPTTCAEIPGGTVLSLTEDIWAGSLVSPGEIVLGELGTARTLTLADELQAPLATVNAAWGGYAINKSMPGETVFAGSLDRVRYVTVGDGVCTLAVRPANDVVVAVSAPGVLKVAAETTVCVRSLTGNGTLCGEGRFDFASGDEVTITAALSGLGTNLGLFNGTTLKFAGGTDFAGASVYVENPVALAEAGTVLVAVDGKAVHRPALVYPGSDTDRQWRLKWSDEKSGFVVVPRSGFALTLR